jgi:hypothetical protein
MNRWARQNLAFLSAVVVLLGLLCTSRASAYIDPGTGSYVLQIVAAGILAGLLMVKVFWGNFKESLSRLFLRRRRDDK